MFSAVMRNGKACELECLLTAEEQLARQRIDFLNLLVGHRVAAARRAVAMHHQFGAGIALRTVIGVRKAGVEGEIVIGGRIHLSRRDGVEALGRLPVAFLLLRTEIARPAADRIGLQQRVFAVAILFPDLHLRFFLEDAGQDRRILLHVLVGDFGERLFRQRRLRAAGRRNVVGIAAGKRNRRGNCRGRQQGAYEASSQNAVLPEGADPH